MLLKSTSGEAGAPSECATTFPWASTTCTATMRWSVSSSGESKSAAESTPSPAAISPTRRAAASSTPASRDWYNATVNAAPDSASAMNTTAPAMNAERAAILHRRGLIRDKLRRRASVEHDGLTCPGHAVWETATRRRPACAASSLRLPAVETPFAAAEINSAALHRADNAEPRRRRRRVDHHGGPERLVGIDRDHPALPGCRYRLTLTCLVASIPGWKARRAQQLSALQASLQSLHAGRTDPRHKPPWSQPTRSWATGLERAISNRCQVIMAADPDHLRPITQVGMEADSGTNASGR